MARIKMLLVEDDAAIAELITYHFKREPATSWGLLISDGANALNPIRVYWWLVVFPGTLLALTLFCLNSVGDGLRDAFDVQQK